MLSNEQYDELVVTTALLLGAEFYHDDFGHPERKHARRYWSAWVKTPEGTNSRSIFGFTKVGCAEAWLWVQGLRVDRDGSIKKRRL